IEAVVEGRFGGEIGRIAVALVAAAIAYGLVLGFLADGLVALREWLHPAYPMRMRRWLRVLLGVMILHAFIELRAMASDPPLYAAAWYARSSRWGSGWRGLAPSGRGGPIESAARRGARAGTPTGCWRSPRRASRSGSSRSSWGGCRRRTRGAPTTRRA